MKTVKVLSTVIILILIITIIPYFILSFFANPSADDFHYWHEAAAVNPWDFQVNFYRAWSGRYFATAVISLFPLMGDPLSNYKLIPLFLLTALLGALFLFLKSLAQNLDVSNLKILIAALAIFGIYINNMPTTSQGFYWLSGAATYTLGSILLIFLLSLLFRSEKILKSHNTLLKIAYSIGCCLLTGAIVGSSESTGVQIVLIAFFGTLITTFCKHPSAILWKITLVAALIFLSASFLAPGNFARQEEIDIVARRPLFLYLLAAIGYSLQSLNSWVSNLTLLGATVLALPTAIPLAKQFNFLNRFQNKRGVAIVYIIAFLSVTFSSFFLIAFLKRLPVPDRVLNTSYLLFLLGWFVGIFVFANLAFNPKKKYDLPKNALIAIQVISIVALLSQVNFIQSANDLLRIPRYQNQVKERYELINSSLARNELNVKLPTFTNPPETIFNPDITEDPTYYMNEWYAKFFNLNSVVLIERQ